MLLSKVKTLNKSMDRGYTSHFIKGLLLQVLMFFILGMTFAQEPVLQFKHLDMSDGFSDNRISQVVQDKNGIIWAATRLGVNRYDGEKVSVYPLDSIVAIYDLKVIGVDNILVATDKGLYTYHKKRDRFELFNIETENTTKAIFNQGIFSISNSNSQDFWITGRAGKFYFVRESEKIYKFSASQLNSTFPNTNIISLSEGQNGKLWLGTSNGGVWDLTFKQKNFVL